MKTAIIFCLLFAIASATITEPSLVEVVGPISPAKDDARSEVGCPEGHTVYSCECRHPQANGCDGVWLIDNTCRAYASYKAASSRIGVKAAAQCFATSDVGFSLVTVDSGANWQTSPVASCPVGRQMVACWLWSPWAPLFGAPRAVRYHSSCYSSVRCARPNNGCKIQGLCTACPDGFETYGNLCYSINPTGGFTHDEAEAKCAEVGTTLFQYRSVSSFTAVRRRLKASAEYRAQKKYWVKHERADTNSMWTWGDGGATVYDALLFWNKGEPNNKADPELCMNLRGPRYKLNDANCLKTGGYICSIYL